MQFDHIQYRGRYEYSDSQSLERALRSARATLDDEEVAEIEVWLRFFVSRGTSLIVNLTVPDCSEHRFAAANVFLVLAHGATDGSVEAVQGARRLDVFDGGSVDEP